MNPEQLPTPGPFEGQLNYKYVANPSTPSYERRTEDPDTPHGGRYFMTRPSEAVEVRYNLEVVLAPDSVSDAFGRMAVYSLGGYYARGGERDLPTREWMAGRFGDTPEDYRYANSPVQGHRNASLIYRHTWTRMGWL